MLCSKSTGPSYLLSPFLPIPLCMHPLQLYFLWTDTQVPGVLQTDNGSEFIASRVKELCEAYGVEMRHGAVGNPQAQGAVERHNQILKNKISAALLEAPKVNWSFQASGIWKGWAGHAVCDVQLLLADLLHRGRMCPQLEVCPRHVDSYLTRHVDSYLTSTQFRPRPQVRRVQQWINNEPTQVLGQHKSRSWALYGAPSLQPLQPPAEYLSNLLDLDR